MASVCLALSRVMIRQIFAQNDCWPVSQSYTFMILRDRAHKCMCVELSQLAYLHRYLGYVHGWSGIKAGLWYRRAGQAVPDIYTVMRAQPDMCFSAISHVIQDTSPSTKGEFTMMRKYSLCWRLPERSGTGICR